MAANRILNELETIRNLLFRIEQILISSNNDFNIIKILLGFIPIIFYIQGEFEASSIQYLIIWVINVIFLIVVFIWGVKEFLLSKTLFMSSVRWITVLLILCSPLLMSIMIVFNVFSSYSYLNNVALFIITLYAVILSFYACLKIFINRVIRS